MIYKIGICDDERGLCARLEEMIYDYFSDCSDSVDMYVWYTGENCCNDLKCGISLDILFLDIELPGENGVNVGKYIRETLNNNTLQIVYISSKTNYAMELFQIHPYDFLVKPITKKQLLELFKNLEVLEKEDQKTYTYFVNGSIYKIGYGKIQYLMSQDKHIIVVLSDGTIRKFRGKLKDQMNRLTPQFVRIGQSYIVNMKYVNSYHYDHVIMCDGVRINISQPFRIIFRKQLREFEQIGGTNESGE